MELLCDVGISESFISCLPGALAILMLSVCLPSLDRFYRSAIFQGDVLCNRDQPRSTRVGASGSFKHRLVASRVIAIGQIDQTVRFAAEGLELSILSGLPLC